ncbi:MAG: DNA polymerase III subunit gamma/tau [Clostridia bacterium]|nr:DNA polymerase III subunit gamma/tau [Clostridia bacterium]
MHQALYRKYRPKVFDDVWGQEHITTILKYEAEHNCVSHAYLFAGSRGIGKTTCAKILAKAVNCEHPVNGNPCNKCPSCLAIDSGATTDVIEMDAASNTGVEYIRDLRENVIYTPAMLKKRVYIIDEAHMLSNGAFNALLKTIEEPPEHVLYIFATTELNKVPATIISRCQRFEFRRIASTVIADRLKYIAKNEDISVSEDGAAVIAKLSDGGMRDAISLLELCASSRKTIDAELVNAIMGTSSHERMCRIARAVAEKSYATLFEEVASTTASSKDLQVFFGDLLAFWRNMLVVKSTPNAKTYLDATDAEFDETKKVASLFNLETLLYHCRLITEASAAMSKAPQAKQLTAEMALIRLCDARLTTDADAIASRISILEDKYTLLSLGKTPIVSGVPAPTATSETTPVTPVAEQPTTAQPTAAVEEKEKLTAFMGWDDVIARVANRNQAASGFLKSCACYQSSKSGRIVILAKDAFTKQWLSMPSNASLLYEALICSGATVADVSDIEFRIRNGEIHGDAMDDFDL